MHQRLRSLSLGLAALLGLTAAAQPYSVIVSGHYTPCDPALWGQTVVISAAEGNGPVTTMQAEINMNCYYIATLVVNDTIGTVTVTGPCPETGTYVTNSDWYTVSAPGGANVNINLDCGQAQPTCSACFTMEQSAPFVAVFNSDCSSTALGTYTVFWDFSDTGTEQGPITQHTFTGAGEYTVCLNLSDDQGCTDFSCQQVYVDDQGNISLDPPGSVCEACINVQQFEMDGSPTPFSAQIDALCGTTTGVTFSWWIDGQVLQSEVDSIVTFTFGGAGTYGVCLEIFNDAGCSSTVCDTVYVDDNGTITLDPPVMDCQACILPVPFPPVGDPVPYVVTFTSCSEGTGDLTYSWTSPVGTTYTDPELVWQFGPVQGPHVVCLNISDASGCTSTVCDTLVFDSDGFISNDPIWYDCLGQLWGPNVPGSPCTDPATGAGTWSANCACVPTACHACIITAQDSTPGNGLTPFTAQYTSCSTGEAPLTYLWDFGNGSTSDLPNPLYQYDAPGIYLTCLTITDNLGCTSFTCDTLVIDTNGIIDPFPTPDCEAGFWTIQAYDSTGGGVAPIPNEVWVWNLSSGGNGNFQFLWSFGDGTSSTDAFPTHTYSGPGPWLLCLTMYSDNCTDTYCDSVSVDENGILNGLMPDGHGTFVHERSDGFTLNVIQQLPTGIAETAAIADLKTWPNPVDELLHISFLNRMAGEVDLTVTDPLGRTVLSRQLHLGSGSNLLQVPTDHLEPGLYLVRIGQGPQGITQRFMKVR